MTAAPPGGTTPDSARPDPAIDPVTGPVPAVPAADGQPLGRRAARGAVVTLGGQVAKLVLQLVGIIVLARLLSPRDYGLLAMVVAFTGLGDLLRDFGLSSASIQARTVSRDQRSNLFWLNTGIGLVLSVIALACAEPISWLFDEPAVALIVRALAVVFLLDGLSTQFRADLNRSMRFGRLAGLDLVAQFVALGTAIVLAAANAGVWALVAQQLVQAALVLVLLLVFARLPIGLPRRGVPMRGFLTFGGNMLLTQLLVYASRNVDSIVVGARFGPTVLGTYNRAFQLLSLPLNQVNAPATTVALPVLSRLQDDPKRFDEFLFRGQALLMNLVLAIFAFAASQADPLIRLVLGPQWAPSVHLFQILAIAGIFTSAGYATYWVFLARGRTDASLRYALVGRPLLIAFIIGGVPFGVTGVAVGYAIGNALLWPLGLWWVGRTAGAPSRQLFLRGSRTVAVYATCAVPAALVPPLVTGDLVLRLVLGTAILLAALAAAVGLVPTFRRSLVELRSTAALLRPQRRAG